MRKLAWMAAGLILLASPAMAQMGGGMGGMGGGMGHGGGGGSIDPAGDDSESHADHPSFHPHVMKPIAQEKFDRAVSEMFAGADLNHDGMVTLAELQQVIASRREAVIRARFAEIDTNRDGRIDLAEFVAWQNDMGDAANSDCAGYAGAHELVPESLGAPLGDSEQDAALAAVIEPMSALMLTHANVHYRPGATLADVLAYEDQRFAAADTDHDGYLEADEIAAWRNAHGQGGAGAHGWHRHGGG